MCILFIYVKIYCFYCEIILMDCIPIVLIIYEIQWDDVDEDGGGGRGVTDVCGPSTRTPKIFHALFLKISRN